MPPAAKSDSFRARTSLGGWISTRTRDRRVHQRAGGAALVIVLSLLVIVTTLVVAFITWSRLNFQVEESGANRIEAEVLARSSVSAIIGDLRQEMLAGSLSNNQVAGFSVLHPNPTNAAVMLPSRVLVLPSLATDTNFAVLAKQSASQPFFPSNAPYDNPQAAAPVISGASSVSTAEPSRNQRVISTARWNGPKILPGGGFTSTNQLPHWAYFLRDSGITPGSPTTNAIGRAAYNIYDVSGLLDINVAGYDETGGFTQNLKASLAGARLSAIPGITAPGTASLTDWRNAASGTNYINYATKTGPARGFLSPVTGDNFFLNRQDLIRYVQQRGGSEVSTNALPYLTTFNRMRNAPSFGFAFADAPNTGFSYGASANTSTSTNRFVPDVRVVQAFIRNDGSTAIVGEPLIKNKFPLSRLALFADPVANAANIEKYFGLTPDGGSGGWIYRNNAADILRLDQVAGAGREPDFFELLKAGLLSGSLGAGTRAETYVENFSRDQSKSRQILAIGANIADQYDSDHAPTIIRGPGGAEDVAGIENLPYINSIYNVIFRRKDKGTPTPPSATANAYLGGTWPYVKGLIEFELWNPHANAASAPALPLRLIGTTGTAYIKYQKRSTYPHPVAGVTNFNSFDVGAGEIDWGADQPALEFQNSSTFERPRLLEASLVTASTPECIYLSRIAGLPGGEVFAPSNLDADNDDTNDYIHGATGDNIPASIEPDGTLTAELQVQISGTWMTYQQISFPNGLLIRQGTVGPTNPLNNLRFATDKLDSDFIQDSVLLRSDPRSTRFGASRLTGNAPAQKILDGTIRHPTAPTYGEPGWGKGNIPAAQSISDLWNGPSQLADSRGMQQLEAMAYAVLAENDPNQTYQGETLHMLSPDGWTRKGDGAGATMGSNTVYHANSPFRPVMLNRPFQTLAELGYAFRDEPWKSLDFSTEAVASGGTAGGTDGALLELFSLEEEPATRAGTINPNRAPAPVLEAVLAGIDASGATLDETAIAAALTDRLNDQPVADLFGFPGAIEAVKTTLPTPKHQREAVARALAGISNTRTWNLMIDVIAQAGKFPRTSTGPADFIVDGEQRYWVHVAIDRITGEIVAIQWEGVVE